MFGIELQHGRPSSHKSLTYHHHVTKSGSHVVYGSTMTPMVLAQVSPGVGQRCYMKTDSKNMQISGNMGTSWTFQQPKSALSWYQKKTVDLLDRGAPSKLETAHSRSSTATKGGGVGGALPIRRRSATHVGVANQSALPSRYTRYGSLDHPRRRFIWGRSQDY